MEATRTAFWTNLAPKMLKIVPKVYSLTANSSIPTYALGWTHNDDYSFSSWFILYWFWFLSYNYNVFFISVIWFAYIRTWCKELIVNKIKLMIILTNVPVIPIVTGITKGFCLCKIIFLYIPVSTLNLFLYCVKHKAKVETWVSFIFILDRNLNCKSFFQL